MSSRISIRGKLQNVASIPKGGITDVKRNAQKRRITIAAMRAEYSRGGGDGMCIFVSAYRSLVRIRVKFEMLLCGAHDSGMTENAGGCASRQRFHGLPIQARQ